MKRTLHLLALCLFLILGSAQAEGMIPEEKLASLLDFAREQGILREFRQILEAAFSGDLSIWEVLAAWWMEKSRLSAAQMLSRGASLAFPALMMALMRAVLPDGCGGAKGVFFLLRIQLMLIFSQIAASALDAAASCLGMVIRFTDAVAPLLAFLFTAAGMDGTAALVTPAAALAGSAAEKLFLRFGLPLCRIALCTAIAGNLSAQIDLKRITALLRRLTNWGSGLATTLFTGLLALQGCMTESLDGLAVRTAKFAVDSASPVIGSGVSDTWESYISGIMIAKNALGISGIAGLLLVCAAPVLCCLAAMLLLTLCAALLSVFGEREASRAASEIAGICQMALSLCTSALAIGMILLGAAMSAGRSLPG